MVLHGRIAAVAGPFVRSQLRGASRYIYSTLRIQDRIIDKTYRKAGLYNRGVVTGIKHGLIAGQVAGGIMELGLNAPDTPGNGGTTIFKKQPKAYKSYKTRYRSTIRSCPEYPVKSGLNRVKRRSYSR